MSNALDLLKSLGLGVRGTQPTGAGSATGTAQSVGGMTFADLLNKASGGEFSSGQEVTISKGAGIDLTGEQLQRLAKIADSAEAQGANRVLVLMDGKAFKLDVAVRQVTGSADLNGVVTGVDAVVAAPISGATATTAAGMKSLSNVMSGNASLINTLASLGR